MDQIGPFSKSWKRFRIHHSKCIIFFLTMLCVGSLFSFVVAESQPRQKKTSKIFLIHADRLRYNQYENPEAQILNGSVHFLHDAMHLYCDSAYFYQASNSFEAFGNVRMTEGDTLSLTSDYLYYDGETQIAKARSRVVLRHRASTLFTDSLNYDKLYDVGYFFEGGKLLDGDNVLTSEWGQYSPATRKAVFNYNVKLVNPKFELTSDTLHYNTLTRLAEVKGPSNIINDENRIYTEKAFYNTQTEKVRLYNRSVVVNPERRMVGDSLFYDKKSGVMKAYNNIVYEDIKNKNIMLGDYCEYNELTGTATGTRNALLKDFSSSSDTLFMHADTLRMFSYNLHTDSLYRVLHGYYHVRSYRTDVQAVSDSMKFDSRNRCLSLYRDPIVWYGKQQIFGEEINVFFNDSTIDSARVERQAFMAEQLDSIHFNQISAKLLRSYFHLGEISENRADGNVLVTYYPYDSDSVMIGMNYTETTRLRMFFKDKKFKRLWAPGGTGTFYPLPLVPKERQYLENFHWFDYIRPRDKHDLFEWRGKKAGTELKVLPRREAPLPELPKHKKS